MHYTILRERKHTGISVQTLHPTKFDHGKIIAQTPFPGIPVPDDCTIDTLTELMAPLGAGMLVQAIRERAFVEPVKPVEHSEQQIQQMTDGNGLSLAPKITSEDGHIKWDSMSNKEVLLRDRITDRLWDEEVYAGVIKPDEKKRITYGTWQTESNYDQSRWTKLFPGVSVGIPVTGEGKIRRSRPSEIMKEDANEPEDSPIKRIYTSTFTIDGKPKNKGGNYFAEVLAQRELKMLAPYFERNKRHDDSGDEVKSVSLRNVLSCEHVADYVQRRRWKPMHKKDMKD